MEKADIKSLPRDVRQRLVELVKHCHTCQMKQAKPRRFMFSVRDPAVGQFIDHLQIDVVALIDGSVLHIIDIGTYFQNEGFIGKMDAGTAGRLLQKFWVDVFTGAPDYINTDTGTNFNSEQFKNQASSMWLILRIVPTEEHERIGLIEQSHAYFQNVYKKVCIDLPYI